MAPRTPPETPSANLLVKAASLSFDGLKRAFEEPVITGGLLYLLTRGPQHIRERMLQPLQSHLLLSRLPSFITFLKLLTAVGVARRVSQSLNRLAWNNWSFGRPGAPFKFGPGKKELVVITGGSSGFGYEMVKLFNEHARVVVLDVSPFPDELAQLSDVFYYTCDVTDTNAVVELCEEIRTTHGDPSVLINNAGIATGKTVLETSNEQCERLFKVNLTSHFVLIREFLPGMLRMKKGHIVEMASMASFIAAPGLLDYCCSKVGAMFVAEGIRAECFRYPGGEGICTTSVHPSWHDTGIIKVVEGTLRKHGIRADPAINVARIVVDQVLMAKSGRIFAPKGEEAKVGLRNWPVWMQDLLIGNVFKEQRFDF
ncbi:NAD(P)-binding protein [Polyplosphaeria fusca]|uniref:NAD(P)-binding protein n=1 Tax=Polyplosphaeria fusca TaxID=682080 RepID=A0A9P4QPQ9_9PLEO|nr:NAD(P)-binding protein [Polyplosphaeria fusca]